MYLLSFQLFVSLLHLIFYCFLNLVLLCFVDLWFFTVFSYGRVGQRAPPDFFNRGTNPINEDRASWPSFTPKTSHAKSITLGIRFLIYVFCGYTYIQSIALKGLPKSLCLCFIDLYLSFKHSSLNSRADYLFSVFITLDAESYQYGFY